MATPEQREMDRALRMLEDVGNIFRRQLASPQNQSIASPATSTGAGASSVSAIRSQNVNEETRRAFLPYDQTGRIQRRTQSSASRLTSARREDRLWHHRIYCLGGPEDMATPSSQRNQLLQSNELGLRVLRIGRRASAEQFRTEIMRIYPVLSGLDFEVLRAVGGGQGKHLVRISPAEPIPLVSDAEVILGTAILYIRPMIRIELEYDSEESSQRGNQRTLHPFLASAVQIGPSTLSLNSPACIEPAQVNSSTADSVHEVDDDSFGQLMTISEFRENIYRTYSHGDTQKIVIQRDEFCMSVLGIYKKPVDLYKPVEVTFLGETGADAGALTKEFFWLGIVKLRHGKFNDRIPFFEGQDDHKLPFPDGSLVRLGIFDLVGKFMLHATIHMGVGFVGLSDIVMQYIFNDDVSQDRPLDIKTEDIPDAELQVVIRKLDTWIEDHITPAPDDFQLIQAAAFENDFNDSIRFDNAALLREHLLYFSVVEKRKSQLDCFRRIFRESKLMEFLKGKEYLFISIFPKSSRFIYPASVLLARIQSNGDHAVAKYVMDYISAKLDGNDGTQKLITAWTGWPEIPSSSLRIEVVPVDEDFTVRTCYQEIRIPENYTKEMVYDKFDLLIKFGCHGFGTF